jgi:hypothetical protein
MHSVGDDDEALLHVEYVFWHPGQSSDTGRTCTNRCQTYI